MSQTIYIITRSVEYSEESARVFDAAFTDQGRADAYAQAYSNLEVEEVVLDGPPPDGYSIGLKRWKLRYDRPVVAEREVPECDVYVWAATAEEAEAKLRPMERAKERQFHIDQLARAEREVSRLRAIVENG